MHSALVGSRRSTRRVIARQHGTARLPALAAAAGLAAAAVVHAQTPLRVPPEDAGIRYLPDGKAVRLKGFLHGQPVWEASDNSKSADTIGVDEILSGGSSGYALSGSGQKVAVFEAGGLPMFVHSEFGGRVTFRSTWSPFADEVIAYTAHATHVTGTIAASGLTASAKGMAPSVGVTAWDSEDVINEMTWEAAAGTKVSNHSYSMICGYEKVGTSWRWYGDTAVSSTEDYKLGYYDQDASDWDAFACAYPYHLPVVTAGNNRADTGPGAGAGYYVYSGGSWVWTTTYRANDGGSTGYDSLSGGKALAKNVLTVGAVSDIIGGYSGTASVTATTFTSYGPTDDGRIKPDVVANGQSVYSTNASYGGAAYTSMSGTSMAAPAVTGTVALLHEQLGKFFPGTSWLSSTLKALVIHSASEAGPYDGPDYKFGYGLVNAHLAAKIIDDAGSSADIFQDTYTGSARSYALTPTGGAIRVTLCYTDEAGPVDASASLDPATLRLVNDFDAILVRSWHRPDGSAGAVLYRPWCLNPALPANMAVRADNDRDNVEVIDVSLTMLEPIGAGATETWSLWIGHERLAAPTTASRLISVVMTGARRP